VAIATYNRAAMVPSAIQAALAQSRAPVEVVVSDDASSDDTLHVLARLAGADPRVKLLRQKTNSGGVRNWNYAIAATCGDLIAWCSDDDCYRAGHLQASAAYLEAHPEVGLVHSGFVDWIDTPDTTSIDYRPLRVRQPLVVDRSNLFRYLLRYYDWPFHPSTIVMRRRVWEEVGPFDPAYALADTDWFVRAARKFPVALLARYGVNNRRHLGNWSNRLGSARMQQEISEIVERAIESAYGAAALRKRLWRHAWRANSRLRLLLTVRARLRTGHADAACAAWNAVFAKTEPASSWFARAGEDWLRAKASRAVAVAVHPRQRVSPL
jgi:glycosyltransferase involved in cell wall biosynthesis